MHNSATVQTPRRDRATSNPVRFLRNTLRSSPALRNRDLRVLMSASFFDAIGFMGEQVVISWLILDLTDDPFMVGVALALRMVPLLILGIPAGAVADMVDRRMLIRLLNMVMALLMVGIGALIFLDICKSGICWRSPSPAAASARCTRRRGRASPSTSPGGRIW